MSEMIRKLIKDEYVRTYGELPKAPARDQIGIPGHVPKGGHSDEAFDKALAQKGK